MKYSSTIVKLLASLAVLLGSLALIRTIQYSHDAIERVHIPGNESGKYHMPYSLALKVHYGKTVYLSGLNAAPLYHSHPHVSSEFDNIPIDATEQTEIVMQSMQEVLKAAGGDLGNVVQMTVHVVDVERNGDAIQNVTGRYFGTHTPASTVVEVPAIITDPRLLLEITAVAVVSD